MNVIEAKNVVKNYQVREIRSTSIKELVLKHLFKLRERKEIQALRGISFTVEQGQAIGIIGNNGSGKTTLLKLIAGITPPSEGSIEVIGRVGALLELGVGFHPELSGLENIFLNAAMLGLKEQEIKSRLDSIIGFAELEKFINTPLKHYSAGMCVRLGFSIAINIDPDILLIDEILAVGDSQFQVKSLAKIKEFKRNGKTILIVTHHLEQAEPLCDEFIWLEAGQIKMQGSPNEVSGKYISESYKDQEQIELVPYTPELVIMRERIRMGSGEAIVDRVAIKDERGQEVWRLIKGKKYQIELCIRTQRPIKHMDCGFGIGRKGDSPAITYMTASQKGLELKNLDGKYTINLIFDQLLIEPGQYNLNIIIYPFGQVDKPYDLHLRLYPFTVIGSELEESGPLLSLPARFELIRS